MASLLFTISGAVVNALAFSRFTYHGKEERKRHDLALEKLERARDEWNKDRMKRFDFFNKRLCEKNEVRAYINNVNEAMFEYYQIFAMKIKPLPLSLNFQTFIIHQGPKKVVNHYLLQWEQALQHMSYTSILDKF